MDKYALQVRGKISIFDAATLFHIYTAYELAATHRLLFFETFPFRSPDGKMPNVLFFSASSKFRKLTVTQFYFPSSVQSVLSLCQSLYCSPFMGRCVFVRCTSVRVRACYFLLLVFVFVLQSLVHVWLADWVKCQSHFAFITWGTKRRALLCNLSLPVAAAQPLMYLGTHSPQLHRGFKTPYS